MPNGSIEDGDGVSHYGITVGNLPVGSPGFVPAYLSEHSQKIRRGYDRISHLLDPGRWPHPDIPTRQMLWVLMVFCLQFMGDYWLRHIQPDLTLDFALRSESRQGRALAREVVHWG